MKRIVYALIVAVVLMLAVAPSAEAQGGFCQGINSPVRSTGFQALTVSTGAVGLTVPAGTDYAIVLVESQPVRYRDDGSNPTASVGGKLIDADVLIVCGPPLGSIRFIRETSATGDATLNINYYGR